MLVLDILDALFRLLTGGVPLQPVTLALALMVIGMGWLFGKLTTRLGVIRTSLALVVGLYFYLVFAQAQFFGAHLFLIGLFLNHLPLFMRIASWAQDIGDWWFALRYRQTFEDMRAQEQQAEDSARQARREFHRRGQPHSQQDQWRAQAEARRGKQGARQSGSQGKPDHDRTALPNERQGHLQTLSLDPFGTYTTAEIRKAYRQAAKRAHPDLGGSTMQFTAVQSAFEWLIRHP